MEEESIPSPKRGVNIVRTFERDGVSYEFYTKPGNRRKEVLYFLGRVDGVRVSCFQISEEKIEDVELLVDELHESFAIDAKTILEALKTSINDITRLVGFDGFFDTNGMSNYRSFLQNTLSEVNFPAPGGGEPGWVRQGRSCSRRHG